MGAAWERHGMCELTLKIKIPGKKISSGSVARRDLIPALKG
jgi:hypothetical protein